MSINVKARQQTLNIGENKGKLVYIMAAETYNRLDEEKVFNEAHDKSGVSISMLKASWDIIGEVIKTWATEGHIVPLPGLGSIRFGVRATAVEDVEKVKTSLITSRRIVFTPSSEIKDELAKTSISITCYDKDGKVVKRVDSGDDGTVEDTTDGTSGDGTSGDGGSGTSGNEGVDE